MSSTLNAVLPLLATARAPQVDVSQLLQTVMVARPQPDATQLLMQMLPLMRSGGDRDSIMREFREIANIVRLPGTPPYVLVQMF